MMRRPMGRIAGNVTWLIGDTPLLALARLSPAGGARVVAKLERQNPTGSNKDRATLAMVEHAEQAGFLQPGGTIIEASAGDTAVALAMVAAQRGYRLILAMPANTPAGRRNLLRALGARIEPTDPQLGIHAAFARAEQLAREIPGAHVLQPFTNRANARAHARGTAREIWHDTDGEVDVVVCPAGTGGTAAGCAAFFKEVAPRVRVVAVEPATSAVLGGGAPGPHNLPGLGPGFVPDILCVADLAEVIAVAEADAYATLRRLAREEGVLAGPASGAVLHAALVLAARPALCARLMVAVLPDSGERYAEHAAFAEAP
jgi:cysteine synthase A